MFVLLNNLWEIKYTKSYILFRFCDNKAHLSVNDKARPLVAWCGMEARSQGARTGFGGGSC